MTEENQKLEDESKINIENVGEPLCFKNVEDLVGVSAAPAKGGEQVTIWVRMALTSDDPLFHMIAEDFAGVIINMAKQAGTAVNLHRAGMVLLILKPDSTAELWLDTAAVAIKCRFKKSMKAGTVVFENDIADVVAMGFPKVDIGTEDKVIFIFRQGWRFGLAFDMNPDRKFDLEGFEKSLGTLYRHMRYKHLYDALSETATFDRLLAAGWFPFVEIITSEFKDILNCCKAGSDFADVEDKVVSRFDEPRLDRILERWLSKPHFAAKADLMKAAINAFKGGDPISVLKILLTEIEGLLNEAYRADHVGQGARLKKLLKYAEESAERKAGGSNTLLFPQAFGRYLREYIFANFDPSMQTGAANSRHAVGHGAAAQESYTTARALQAILTLDQLAFYT